MKQFGLSRKLMIALAVISFSAAMVASDTGDARGFGGGGFHGGGFRGGGFGGGFRGFGGGFRGGFVGPGRFGFRPGFGFRRFGFRNRFFFGRRFAFAGVPFGVGLGYGSCWRWVPTYWGWQRAWVCGGGYGWYY
jgi:hypothetical protein